MCQRVGEAQRAAPQLLRMAVTFWVLGLIFDLLYAGLAARLGATLRDPRRVAMRQRLSGAILLAAAVALALARA